jgi:4-amino-4-deoxy-L-arabinose transferase-like glycosyltransferase
MTPDSPEAPATGSSLGPGLRSLVSGERGWLLLIFGIALVIRVVYALPHAKIPTGNDMGVYHQLAVGLLTGEGYVSKLEPHFLSWRAPGYPFFLASIYGLVGQHAGVVVAIQCALGALTSVLVARIARVPFGAKVAVVSGLICALNPQMIHWSGELLTETLFTFLFALAILLCIGLRESSGWGRAVAIGLVLGYGTLVRPNLLLFVPLASLYALLFAGGDLRRRSILAIGIPLLAALVLLPWTVRNYRVHGELVPVASIGGVSLFVGIPPSMLKPQLAYQRVIPDWLFLESGQHMLPNGYDLLPELFARPPPQKLAPDFDELEQSRVGRIIFLQFVRHEPRTFAKLLAMKGSQTFNVLPKQHNYRLGDYDVIVRYMEALFLCLTFVFGSLGMLLGARREGPVLLLLAVFFYHVAFQMIFRPAPRYFMPGIVLLTPFTALGLLELRGLARRWREGGPDARARLWAWGAVLVALSANSYYHVLVLRSHYLTRDWDKLAALLGGGGT